MLRRAEVEELELDGEAVIDETLRSASHHVYMPPIMLCTVPCGSYMTWSENMSVRPADPQPSVQFCVPLYHTSSCMTLWTSVQVGKWFVT